MRVCLECNKIVYRWGRYLGLYWMHPACYQIMENRLWRGMAAKRKTVPCLGCRTPVDVMNRRERRLCSFCVAILKQGKKIEEQKKKLLALRTA